jgi:hypothetical protein
MPFIPPEDRSKEGLSYSPIPGERCYAQYKDMMDTWRASPRWTTVDAILADYITDPIRRAEFLAFLVFFQIHVMPYEERKRKENGDI